MQQAWSRSRCSPCVRLERMDMPFISVALMEALAFVSPQVALQFRRKAMTGIQSCISRCV
jgi:hypothetical protein